MKNTLCAAGASLLMAWTAFGQPVDVGLDNHLGRSILTQPRSSSRLPSDSSGAFVDEQGKSVELGQYFHRGRPAVVALVYFGCPGVCTVLLNELTLALRELEIVPGRAFDVLAVSIDPKDGPAQAREQKTKYLEL